MTTTFDRVGGIHSTPRAACVSCSRFLEGAPLAWVVLVVAFPSLVRLFFTRLLVPSTFYLPSFLLLMVAMSSRPFALVLPHVVFVCLLHMHTASAWVRPCTTVGNHIRRSRWVVYTLLLRWRVSPDAAWTLFGSALSGVRCSGYFVRSLGISSSSLVPAFGNSGVLPSFLFSHSLSSSNSSVSIPSR
ncbi:hypothetical protein DFP72DRAFT_508183 [Ephemerocybe angulata]|uniref:Uncharacterized protein n=1 Tax=Ephemerocybe angulata TaxID=980116 RepID=A0A8H6HQ53_9AGAR|nr:hypothetical protein DFP72DRAFT_508183 [Tulosesus angulatus]